MWSNQDVWSNQEERSNHLTTLPFNSNDGVRSNEDVGSKRGQTWEEAVLGVEKLAEFDEVVEAPIRVVGREVVVQRLCRGRGSALIWKHIIYKLCSMKFITQNHLYEQY